MIKFLLITLLILSAVSLICSLSLLSRLKKMPSGSDDVIQKITKLYDDSGRAFAAIQSAENANARNLGERISQLAGENSNSQLNLMKAVSDIREDLSQASSRQTETVRAAVAEMQTSNEKKLDEMRRTVDEKLSTTISQSLDGSFKNVSEQLSNVYKSMGEMKKLSDDISSLGRIFSGVKTRGTWAEGQLESILERTIPGMFVRNFSPKNVSGTVEFAVTLPDNNGGTTYLPIDSKFPVADFVRLSEEAENGNTDGVRQCRAELSSRIVSEARMIKKYIEPPETTPFAIMYLATDALFAEVATLPDNIIDRVHDEFSVMIASPSTITAMLSALSMGFKSVALNKKAADIMDVLADAKKQYEKFGESLEKAHRSIQTVENAISEAAKRNDLIKKSLRDIETQTDEDN
jgi:DNA recombination protein RmuC